MLMQEPGTPRTIAMLELAKDLKPRALAWQVFRIVWFDRAACIDYYALPKRLRARYDKLSWRVILSERPAEKGRGELNPKVIKNALVFLGYSEARARQRSGYDKYDTEASSDTPGVSEGSKQPRKGSVAKNRQLRDHTPPAGV